MTAQLQFGTPITVLSTKPYDPTVEPLIVLTIGDTSWALALNKAMCIAADLQDKADKNPGTEQTIVYTIGNTSWGMSGDAASRIATALENEIAEVGGVE